MAFTIFCGKLFQKHDESRRLAAKTQLRAPKVSVCQTRSEKVNQGKLVISGGLSQARGSRQGIGWIKLQIPNEASVRRLFFYWVSQTKIFTTIHVYVPGTLLHQRANERQLRKREIFPVNSGNATPVELNMRRAKWHTACFITGQNPCALLSPT